MVNIVQNKRSKGVTAFAIYFIVWSIITFITSLGYIIYYILTRLIPKQAYYYGSQGLPTALEYTVEIVGVIGAVILFFAGFFMLKNKMSSLKILKSVIIVLILNNILAIIKNWIGVFKPGSYGYYSAYWSASKIAFDVFAILFWIFVFWFFSRESVKAQLTA